MCKLISGSIVGFVEYSETGGNSQNESQSGLIWGICFAVLTIIFAVGVYCFRQKIVVAIALIKEGSK